MLVFHTCISFANNGSTLPKWGRVGPRTFATVGPQCVFSVEGGHCHLAVQRTMISQAGISNWSHFPHNFSFEMEVLRLRHVQTEQSDSLLSFFAAAFCGWTLTDVWIALKVNSAPLFVLSLDSFPTSENVCTFSVWINGGTFASMRVSE